MSEDLAEGVQQGLDITVRSDAGEVTISIESDGRTAEISTTPEGAYRISESIREQARVAKAGEFDE